MLFVPPLTIRRRDWRVALLINKGSASDDELFEAMYGEWPVKGLHKDTPCPDIVEFKGYFSGGRSLMGAPFTMAYTDPNDPARAIHINRLTLNPISPATSLATSRFAWARLHDVVLDPLLAFLGVETGPLGMLFSLAFLGTSVVASSYRYALFSSITKLLAPSTADIIGEEHIHVLQYKNKAGNDLSARRAFFNHAQNEIAKLPADEQKKLAWKQFFDRILSIMPREHYAQDHELQARLHALMVRGYKAWGRIPANEDELFAALFDMGIKYPPIAALYLMDDGQKDVRDIFTKKSYNDLNPDGSIKEVFLRASQTGYVAAPAGEMNVGLNYFRSEEILYHFWKDFLPALYADLLVKYGNSQGMDHMGFTDDMNWMGLPMRKNASPLEMPVPKLSGPGI